MAGGYFNWLSSKINAASKEIEAIALENDEEDGHQFCEEVVAEMRDGIAALNLASIYANRIERLLSYNDSEIDFYNRLKNELARYKGKYPQMNFERPQIAFQKTEDCPEIIELPKYQTQLAAAFDLQAAESTTIRPNSKQIIRTGLRALIPTGYYVRIESRSGLSAKFSIEKGAGIIDADYCDEWRVILYNHGDMPQYIVAGDRIAQAIVTPCIQGELRWGDVPNKHPDSNRKGGFGSTGV